jgi:hypothetical protein
MLGAQHIFTSIEIFYFCISWFWASKLEYMHFVWFAGKGYHQQETYWFGSHGVGSSVTKNVLEGSMYMLTQSHCSKTTK